MTLSKFKKEESFWDCIPKEMIHGTLVLIFAPNFLGILMIVSGADREGNFAWDLVSPILTFEAWFILIAFGIGVIVLIASIISGMRDDKKTKLEALKNAELSKVASQSPQGLNQESASAATNNADKTTIAEVKSDSTLTASEVTQTTSYQITETKTLTNNDARPIEAVAPKKELSADELRQKVMRELTGG